MNKTTSIIGIIILVILFGGGFLLLKSSSTNVQSESQIQPKTEQAPPVPSPTVATQQQSQNTITLTANGFSPTAFTIKAGETVTWENKSGKIATVDSDPHPMHTSYAPLNLGRFSDGSTLTLTFEKVGTYNYHNHFNPSAWATITVQ